MFYLTLMACFAVPSDKHDMSVPDDSYSGDDYSELRDLEDAKEPAAPRGNSKEYSEHIIESGHGVEATFPEGSELTTDEGHLNHDVAGLSDAVEADSPYQELDHGSTPAVIRLDGSGLSSHVEELGGNNSLFSSSSPKRQTSSLSMANNHHLVSIDDTRLLSPSGVFHDVPLDDVQDGKYQFQPFSDPLDENGDLSECEVDEGHKRAIKYDNFWRHSGPFQTYILQTEGEHASVVLDQYLPNNAILQLIEKEVNKLYIQSEMYSLLDTDPHLKALVEKGLDDGIFH
eukprot:GHVH01016026.1.p1 GENE.GHVH01016026.1~~GHVH01016026.1.p1  ORF type:complete len:286 (+),score=51.00 GHVH01016026.1:80-937(+)